MNRAVGGLMLRGDQPGLKLRGETTHHWPNRRLSRASGEVGTSGKLDARLSVACSGGEDNAAFEQVRGGAPVTLTLEEFYVGMHRRQTNPNALYAAIILHKDDQEANVRQGALRFTAQARVTRQLNQERL